VSRHAGRYLAALVAMIALPSQAADVYTVDKAHSEVGFRIRHMISKVSGRFTDFAGTITADATRPEGSSVEFTIQTASIDTALARRDQHLRSPDFFDVAKFPTITFKSTKVAGTGKDHYAVTGALTMHGISRETTLPVAFLGLGRDPWGAQRAGFSVETTLNRKDFGVAWNQVLDSGGLLLGDDVAIEISVEAVKAKPTAATTPSQ
jgi:polyisoprenoid-binding protein YceI